MKSEDVVYLVPRTRYQYDHPEGTGKTESPFQSMWFLGIGRGNVHRIDAFWKQLQAKGRSDEQSELVLTLGELAQNEELSPLFQKRPNPRRRQKKRKAKGNAAHSRSHGDQVDSNDKEVEARSSKQNDTSRKNKKSKYRNANGERKKRRF